jgi:hypothetical protein
MAVHAGHLRHEACPTRVVEIETNSNRGEKKRKTFWRHVGQKNNCVFYWRIVDAEGRRRKSRGNYPGDVL